MLSIVKKRNPAIKFRTPHFWLTYEVKLLSYHNSGEISATHSAIRVSVLSLSLSSSRARPTNFPSTIDRDSSKVYPSVDTAPTMLAPADFAASYNSDIASQKVVLNPHESPQPKIATVLPARLEDLMISTAPYHSSCKSPLPHVELPSIKLSYCASLEASSSEALKTLTESIPNAEAIFAAMPSQLPEVDP